jgi:hypothetical protein
MVRLSVGNVRRPGPGVNNSIEITIHRPVVAGIQTVRDDLVSRDAGESEMKEWKRERAKKETGVGSLAPLQRIGLSASVDPVPAFRCTARALAHSHARRFGNLIGSLIPYSASNKHLRNAFQVAK